MKTNLLPCDKGISICIQIDTGLLFLIGRYDSLRWSHQKFRTIYIGKRFVVRYLCITGCGGTAGPDGAFVYKFITTDEYKKLRLHIYRYESGKLSDQDKVEMGFEDIGSPKSGEIVMVSDFDNYVIKLIISGGGSRLSTEIPILENVENREYYGRTATEIKNVVDIRYDKQQPLIAFVYDNDEMSVPTLDDFINSQTDFLSKNDYVYYVAFEFCK